MKITTRILQHEVEASYFPKMCSPFSYDIWKYRKTMKRMGKRKFYTHTLLRFRAHKTIDRFIARVRLINSRSLEFSLQSGFACTGACRHQAYSQFVTTNFFPLLLLLTALSLLTNVYQSTFQSSVVLFPRKRKFQRQFLVNKFGRLRRSHPHFPSSICGPHQIPRRNRKAHNDLFII